MPNEQTQTAVTVVVVDGAPTPLCGECHRALLVDGQFYDLQETGEASDSPCAGLPVSRGRCVCRSATEI